jgi:phospholipid transport system substrate-binding protein
MSSKRPSLSLRTILAVVLPLLLLLTAGASQAADAPTPAPPSASAKPAKAGSSKAASKATGAAAAESAATGDAPGGGSGKSGPPPANSSPMAELKKSNAALDKVLKKDRPDWSPEAELQRAEVRKVVGSFLDYGELARRSLARHWDTLTPKQRQEFVSTLRELVERSYLRQMHSSPNYNIKYEKETKDGSEAAVTAVLSTLSRGKKVNLALEYKMLWKDSHWVVYDVLTDDQSMLENYRAEFNKIITKESFDALMTKMKRKLDEKAED